MFSTHHSWRVACLTVVAIAVAIACLFWRNAGNFNHGVIAQRSCTAGKMWEETVGKKANSTPTHMAWHPRLRPCTTPTYQANVILYWLTNWTGNAITATIPESASSGQLDIHTDIFWACPNSRLQGIKPILTAMSWHKCSDWRNNPDPNSRVAVPVLYQSYLAAISIGFSLKPRLQPRPLRERAWLPVAHVWFGLNAMTLLKPESLT